MKRFFDEPSQLLQRFLHLLEGFRGRKARVAFAAAAAAVTFSSTASAYDLTPALNLGFTTFFQAVVPSGPGFYSEVYQAMYSSNRLTDQGGNRLPLPRTDVNALITLLQFIYVFPETEIPGNFAFNAVVSFLDTSSTDDGLNNIVLNSQNGLGDLTFGPFYEFKPVLDSEGHEVLIQRIELDFIAPTGAWNPNRAVNAGGNVWAAAPYYAATLHLPPFSLSTRLHYLYSWNNNNPPAELAAAGIRTLQPGQAFYGIFDASYEIAPHFHIGLNAYYLIQFQNTKLNGAYVNGRREQVLGVGPGAAYAFDKNNFLFASFYQETLAENRPQGQKYILRWVHHF